MDYTLWKRNSREKAQKAQRGNPQPKQGLKPGVGAKATELPAEECSAREWGMDNFLIYSSAEHSSADFS